jgi:hypothetical protein
MCQQCGSSSATVYQHIFNYLKLAPHRKVGAGRGCRVPEHLLQAGDNFPGMDEVDADEDENNDDDADNFEGTLDSANIGITDDAEPL